MTDRERLSSLIKQAEQREQLDFITADIDEAIDMSGGTKISCSMEYLADYLLANGVIVLPCKPLSKCVVLPTIDNKLPDIRK